MYSKDQNKECCPEFNPVPWENKNFEWTDKKFIKGKVFTIFYMPVNYGKVVSKMMAEIEKAGATSKDGMGLSDHTSKWNMDLYMAVDREIPGAENVNFTGKFFSKVYEGDFKESEKWCKDFDGFSKGEGMNVSKRYMWYTTCPKCVRKWGKNYVVIIGKLE